MSVLESLPPGTNDITRRFRRGVPRGWQFRVGVAALALTCLIAFLGPFVAPHSTSAILGRPFGAPDAVALLGYDVLGRDVLSRLLSGGVTIVTMATAAAFIGTVSGAVIGLIAASSSSKVDAVIMRCLDVILAFPTIVLALLFVAVFGPNPVLIVCIVGLGHLPSVARIVRGAASNIVSRDFVLWAKSIGMPGTVVVIREVLPNIISPLMVEFGLRLMWSVGSISALSFLGYGIQPPAADWGLMVSENKSALSQQPLSVVAPIFAIAVFTIGANLVAEGIARHVARTEGRSR
ncbi:peptide/nickel transport system permease protein [Microbacterium foliorum]|uniref:Peptide/nickel transport system permease protein n=1 Tax=Microbacterium foliorum TaxID=104336 RepID=A0ABU1HVI4_9MICO|nr:ABC transporter permease [Microbacterium foliorum]MDR6144067.1 peptide/nickel transport system permease protein [Microbacterium foliorum]